MAIPKCPACEGRRFKLTEIKVEGTDHRTYAIHCSSCGAVVGTQEYYNIGTLLTNLAKKLNITLD